MSRNWQELVEQVSLGGNDYWIENVPGDGNCFFHCISAYANGNTSYSHEYRREVCTSIFNDWELWEHKVGLFHGSQMTRYLYWGSLLKHNGWATNCEIEATSLIYGLRINVWLHCPGRDHMLTTFGDQNSLEQITLLIRNNHFQLLHRIDVQSTPDCSSSVPSHENLPASTTAYRVKPESADNIGNFSSPLNDHNYILNPENIDIQNATFHNYCIPHDVDDFEITTKENPCEEHFDHAYFRPSNAKKKQTRCQIIKEN